MIKHLQRFHFVKLIFLILFLLSIVSIFSCVGKNITDKKITGIVDQVDTIEKYLSLLPVQENGLRGYNDDGTPQKDLLQTRDIIYQSLCKSLGKSNVSLQKFDADGYKGVNIIGVIPGTGQNSNDIYILNAHYDSVQNPGADDNGSGVAGLLESASVLSKHSFNATLVFIAFDQEEERPNDWGRGSEFYVKYAKEKNLNIKGVISIDSIGYNHDDNNIITIARPDKQNDSKYAQLSENLIESFHTYTNLTINTMTEEDGSDPYRFFQAGYPAVLVTEQLDSEGWPINPYYHEDSDFLFTLSDHMQKCEGKNYIDFSYSRKILRGVVAWMATNAEVKK